MKYCITILIVGALGLAQYFLWPFLGDSPFIFFYPAVTLAAVYGDGLLAIVLSAVLAQYFFIPPVHSFAMSWPNDWIRQGMFLFSAVLIRQVSLRMIRALARAREAERQLSTTLTSIGDAVIATDDRGNIIFMNPIAEALTEWKMEEARGRPLADAFAIFHETTREPAANPVEKVLRTGEIVELANHTVLLGKKGSVRPIEDSAAPIRSGPGEKVEGVVLVFRDVSERYRIEKDLLVKGEVLENSLNGFDIVNEKGEFVYANRAYLKMWGYDHLDEIIGTSPASHCADPEVPLKIITALKEKGECTIEFVARRKDGTTFDAHMWARLAHDPDGREIYPSTSVDITERKKAEEALKEAVRARDEFISICSHELKTPITSMKLQFQIAERQIQKGDDRVFTPEAVKKRISGANRQLDRMTQLIEEMLDVTRLSAGRLRLNRQKCDLVPVMAEIVDRFQEQFFALGASLQARLPEKLEVNCDVNRIEQVISNLLTNALKYGNRRPVFVSLAALGDNAVVAVKDEGLGIAPENLERIFHRFERAVSAKNISGLGLGLYISFQIVEAHGGRIWADSALGKGTTFYVELPLA